MDESKLGLTRSADEEGGVAGEEAEEGLSARHGDGGAGKRD